MTIVKKYYTKKKKIQLPGLKKSEGNLKKKKIARTFF